MGIHYATDQYATVELEKEKPVNIRIKYNELWGYANVRLM
jgi:hypothetical protein